MKHVEGITTRRWLRESGFSDEAIATMGERGQLSTVGRGTFLLEGAVYDRRRRIIAALMLVGRPVAVTDEDALWLRGHLDSEPGHDAVDLLVPHPRNPTRRGSVRIRSATTYTTAGVERVGIMPIVSPAWALTDVARYGSRRRLARLLVSGTAVRWAPLEEVRAIADMRGTFPGSGRLRRALDHVGQDLSFSGTERKLTRELRGRGMAVSQNVLVRDDAGRAIGRADVWVDRVRLDVEVDGPHHWLPDVAAADRVRDRRMRDVGAEVLRFSVYEIDADVRAVVDEIARTADARAHA